MGTTLTRAPEIEPASVSPGQSPGLLDAGLISRLGRGPLPDVEIVGVPAAGGKPVPRRRRPSLGRLPLPRPTLPRTALPPLSPRPARPLPPASGVSVASRPAVGPPRPAAGAPAAPVPALPELAPWINARPGPPAPPPRTRRAVDAPPRRRRGLLSGGIALAGVAATAAIAAAVGVLPFRGQADPAPAGPRAASALLLGVAPAPTLAALREIPPEYLGLYMRIGAEMRLDWRFLAAIGAQESDHGRNPWVDQINRSGCVGPMQIGVGGDCGDFLAAWRTDGDGDGRIDPRDPADAIATAARGLREGKGAPAPGGAWSDYRRAACGYYGACADDRADYADEVMARAERYGLPRRS